LLLFSLYFVLKEKKLANQPLNEVIELILFDSYFFRCFRTAMMDVTCFY
jgi:hypothetical protein